MKHLLVSVMILLSVMAMPVAAQESCVDNFDPAVDYFPDKLDVTHATGFSIEYFNNYKVLTVSQAWAGADATFEYVLVQCGTPAPEGFNEAQIIEVPVGEVMAMSTTYLPHLAELGVVDHLVGMDTTLYANTPAVLEKIDAGDMIEIGSGSEVNIELVLDAEPDLVFTYGSGYPDFDPYPVLAEAGIPFALSGDFAEADPIGRAEWLKFTAVFFNKEAEANTIFDNIVDEYTALLDLTANLSDDEKPLVLPNTFLASFGEVWNIPSPTSYAGILLNDAGTRMVLGDAEEIQLNPDANNFSFSFESVYEAGLDADYWLTNAFLVSTKDDLLAQDDRYSDFAAFQNGEVYNNNAIENANGGNDYFESGVINPQVILADLIHIFHPDLLPDHALVYFRKLD